VVLSLGVTSRRYLSALPLGVTSRRYLSALPLGVTSRRYLPAEDRPKFMAPETSEPRAEQGSLVSWCVFCRLQGQRDGGVEEFEDASLGRVGSARVGTIGPGHVRVFNKPVSARVSRA